MQAEVDRTEHEERERMEAEARVLDIARFDSVSTVRGRGVRRVGLSKAVS